MADTHFKGGANGLQDGINGLSAVRGGDPQLRQVKTFGMYIHMIGLFQLLKNLNQCGIYKFKIFCFPAHVIWIILQGVAKLFVFHNSKLFRLEKILI